MSVRDIGGLSPSARKWVIASYVFEAKLKIDSLSYIAKYHMSIPVVAIQNMIEPLYLSFFIECAATVDNYIDTICNSNKEERKKRNELQKQYDEIKEIYYWRDKFAAHHDLDALGYGLCGSFSDWPTHIKKMKALLQTVIVVCKDGLPESFKIDYIIHDPIAYRLVNCIDRNTEEQIYNSKYPFRNMGKGIIGESFTIINSVDEACRYLRIKNVLAHPEKFCCILEMGINDEESNQNIQKRYIILNVLYDFNVWDTKKEN